VPFVVNVVASLLSGAAADRNPWHATTLEWTAPSPPPHGNFITLPVVYRGPYHYSVPPAAEDWVPQDQPPARAAAAAGGA
jgi:cytochrome c oxidase subunit 1